jgi:phosphoribosylglycinamide formyltransferase 2
VIKPVMSSSGKGQSVVRNEGELQQAWDYAQSGGRAGRGRVIVEGLVDFDYEITLLTVRHADGVSFCAPIGHRQEDGDYRESWQPQPMSSAALDEAQRQAAAVTAALGGWGVFGVEFFVKGDRVIFSEVSPRPHDTGLVTLISQEFSEFALHARAILGLPIPVIHQYGPSASCAVLLEGDGVAPRYQGVAAALGEPDTQLRLFGKPSVSGRRRMAVTLARADTLEAAVAKAIRAREALRIEL